MRRSERGEPLTAPTSAATHETGLCPDARAARRPRTPAVRIVACLLVYVTLFQPPLAAAAALPAHERQQPFSLFVGAWQTAGTAAAGLTSGAKGALDYVSSYFDSAPAAAAAEPEPVPTPTPDRSITAAAVSRNTPNLNSGHINGSLRVFESKSYSLNNGTTVSGDLYTAGAPSLIRTNNGSTYGGTINDGGAATPSGFKITLNQHSVITGKVHVRANAIPLPGDIPASLPPPAGTRTVNINTAADVTNIGDWATVLDLNVNAPNLIIDVPPGNYRHFGVNAASRLNFTAGVYNFSDTLYAGTGATVQSSGVVTINCAAAFDIDGAKMTLGANTKPGDVRLNVLGEHADLFHASEINALVRGANAQVHLNQGSVVNGQVIAGVLHMSNDSRINGDVSYSPPADSQQPTIAITAPSHNSTTTDSSATVSGTASDPGANATGVAAVYVNDVPATYNPANGQWVLAGFQLAVGPNTITARAVDGAGNQASVSVVVTRQEPPDTTPPAVAITSPADGSTTTSDNTTVSGTASDPGTPSSGIARVMVNGAQANFDAATGTWTIANVALAEGPNTITATAFDNAGKQTSAAVTVTRRPPGDTQAPTVQITSPAGGSSTEAETVTVSGAASDSGANASGVAQVTVNGQAANYDAAAGTWTISNFALAVGPNTITAVATDGAGNQSSPSTITVERRERDTQPPTLVITSPADNSTTTSEFVNLTGTATDTGANASGVAHVYVGEREAQYDAQTGRWSLDDVVLLMGVNQIPVRAVDRADNVSAKTVTVTRRPPPDTTAPNLFISSPNDGASTQEESVTVSGTASDPGEFASGVAQVTVNGQAATFDPQTGQWTLAGVALNVGPNTIEVRAVDTAGNSTPQSLHVQRVPPPDTVAPTIVITSPADSFVSPDATITVTGTAIDEGPYAAGVRQVTVNGQPATYDANTHQWTAQNVPLAEGPNVIRAVAEDGSTPPNRGEATINVTRRTPDTQAPTVQFTAPLTPFETFEETVSVAGTATDDGLNAAGVAGVTVNGRAATFDPQTGRWSLTGVALAFGDNVIEAVATDKAPAANRGRAEIHVTRKQIPPPTLTIVNPLNGAVLAATSVTVAGNVSSMRPQGLTVTVNGEPATISGGQYTKTVQLAEGANTITAVATDSLGQQTQLSASVVRDLTPPTVSFVSTPASVQPGGSYRVTVDASDNIGVADVEFKVGGQHVETSSASPYEFTLNVPAALAAGNTLVLTAVARDLTGTTAVTTAQTRTTGPGAVSGYVFDDATGYVLKDAAASLNAQTPAATDAEGLYSFVSAAPTGVVRLSKPGYTLVERLFSVNPGEGTALFDARLTPLDPHANALEGAGGAATGDGGRLRVQFDPGALNGATDVRVTNVSPQGLANLLPYGWSPAPGAVVDVRPASGAAALNVPAHLSVAQTQYLSPGASLTLARYDEAEHGWTVVAVAVAAGPNGSLAADLPAFGQYAFLVADEGTTAPPPPVVGRPLPSSLPADVSSLDAASATAVATPRAATYSADARSTINFVADAPRQLPSGVAVEASFGETYRLLGGNEPLLVDRPAQDFILYAFPAAGASQPNRLGAFFIAKPTRTEFTITELLGANVHVEIRSGRQPRIGTLVGGEGGQVRAASGGRLTIPAGAVSSPRPVYFSDVPPDVANVQLPAGYEIVAAFDVDLSGGSLSNSATITAPSVAGDLSRLVVARVVTVGGQRGPKVVARAVEENGQLVSTTTGAAVPPGVTLAGVRVSGRYLFVRVPAAFGYAKGTARGAGGAAADAVRVTADQTPFIDVTGADGGFVVLGAAGAGAAGANQLSAAALTTDATGRASATLGAQDAVAAQDIQLAATLLAVESVAPASGAQGVIVTTPVTLTFNKPVAAQSITGSSFTVTTAAGNPVLGTVTVLAGSRVVAFTPAATLAGSTTYRVSLTQAVRDIYGKPLSNVFASTFTTAGVVRVDDRLKPERIQIRYPNADGVSRIIVPAGAVPEGSTVVAINNNSGSTASAVAGTQGLELSLQARVGDEVTLVVRQPDGVEYRVTQGAYRRDDGVTSVGASGGTATSDDGRLVLEVPPGAITGQADIQMTTKREADITAPREREMSPQEMPFGAGLTLRATGSFKQEKELHLEVAVPGGTSVTEDQRVVFMRPRRIEVGGRQVDAWETLTSGKVEGGRFKSMSPPFVGIWFDPAWWEITVFTPRTFRAVTGFVYQIKAGQPEEPMGGVFCTIADASTTQYPSIFAVSSSNGSFATLQTAVAFSQQVSVKATDNTGREQYAIASPYLNIDPYKNPGLNGLISMFATVKFPDDSDAPDRRPASIQIIADQRKVVDGQITTLGPDERDTLKELGVVPVNTPIHVAVRTNPKIEDHNFKAELYLADNKVQQSFIWRNLGVAADGAETRETEFIVSGEGNYSLRVETYTKDNLESSKAQAEFNFVSLHNPNTRQPIPGAPAVISVTPADRATQVDAGSRVHLEFSEPVKNLVPGTTIYVTDLATNKRHGGKLTSGGVPIGANTDNISNIDFEPDPPLEGGKLYEVNVTKGVVDATGEALAGAFTSTFKTFTGVVLTGAGVPDQSYRIAAAGQYAVSVFNQGIGGSVMTVYDMSDPRTPQPVNKGHEFIPQRALAVAMSEVETEETADPSATPDPDAPELFHIGPTGESLSRIAVVTTHALPDIERSVNLWIYSLEDPAEPKIVGVSSLSFPSRTSSIPGQVVIHKKRAYVGTVAQGGLQVVDLEQAMNDWAQAIQRSGSNFTLQHPQVKAVMPNVGFDFEAKVQSVPYGPAPTGNPSAIYAVSVIEQPASIPNLGPNKHVMPVAYVASTKPQLIAMGVDPTNDGINGFFDTNHTGHDNRVLTTAPLNPTGYLVDVRAVKGVQYKGQTLDIAVGLGAERLWIFNATDPNNPVQYPSRSFADLGLGDLGSARRMEVEDNFAYIIFAGKVAVIDFSNPENPIRVSTISNVGDDLRWISVKDGFVYTLSGGAGARAGLNVSIGRPVSQVVVYGVNTSDPDRICTNPVVLQRSTNKMAQPAGVYFQIFGHQLPQSVQVVIRKEKTVGGERTTEVVATVPATMSDTSNEEVIVGTAQWNSSAAIERDALYTAEVVLDKGAKTEFTARREAVPFSYLISEYQTHLAARSAGAKSAGAAGPPKIGRYSYVLGGAAKVRLTVNDQNIFANPDPGKLKEPQEPNDPHIRSYGLNLDPVVTNLAEGKYNFVMRATLEGNDSVFEEVEGELTVADTTPSVRAPGNLVVNGVNITDGGLAVTNTDLHIPNRGLSLSFTRSYNKAISTAFNPLGYGWTHNFQVLLVENKDEGGQKVWQMVGGDGASQVFNESAKRDGKISAEDPYVGTLVPAADGSFDYFTPAHIRYHFPGAMGGESTEFFNTGYMGNLQYMEEPNGNRLTLTYDSKGRMTRVTDSSNRALDFTYELAETPFVGVMSSSSSNDISCTNKKQFGLVRNRFVRADIGKAWRVTQVKGPGGLELQYEYDADGNLEKVTRSGADTVSVATSDSVWQYQYHPTPNVQTPADLTHILKAVKSPNDAEAPGHITQYEYNFQQFGAPVSKITMAEGVTDTFTYTLDAGNRVTHAVVADGRHNETTYEFDAEGHAKSVTGPRGDVTTMTWNAKGLKETETDPEGTKTTIAYDANNNPSSLVIEGQGQRSLTSISYNKTFGKPESTTDANGHTTTYQLDANTGNVRLITMATGKSVELDYYPNGDLRKVIDESNLSTSYEYDGYGNPTKIVKETVAGSTITILSTYDARSRLLTTSSTNGPSIACTYDALDHVIETRSEDPSGVRDGLTVTASFFPEGEAKTLTETGGDQQLVTAFAYDKLDRLKSRTETLNGGQRFVLNYTYDGNSNLLTETDRRGVLSTYTYDELNFRTSHTVSGPFGADARVESVSPDKVGNPKTAVDMYGQTYTFDYDGLHRLRQRTLPNGETEVTDYDAVGNLVTAKDVKGRVTTTAYDELSRPRELKDPAGRVTTWTYDDNTRTVKLEQSPQGLVRVVSTDGLNRPLRDEVKIDGAAYVTTYSYQGRTVEMTDPRGVITSQTLSAFNDPADATVVGASPAWSVQRRYTAFGAPKTYRDPNGRQTSYTSDALGRVTAVSYPGGFSESLSYDGGGNVTAHTDRRGTPSRMTYDNLGRLLSTEVGGADAVTIIRNAYDDAARTRTTTDARAHSTVFKFDALGRVESETNAANQTRTYQYDDVQNTVREGDFKGAVSTFQYDKLDRLVKVIDRSGQVMSIDLSESNGLRRTVTNRRGDKRVESYDALGRLLNVVAGGEPLVSYTYDGNGNRTSAVDGRNNRVDYVYDAMNRVKTVNHASVQTETYEYDAVGNVLNYSDGAGGPVAMTYDALDHLRTRTDGAGNTTVFKYDGEGLLTEKTQPKGNAYKTAYEYNAHGSLKSLTDARHGTWNIEYFPDQTIKSVTDALGHTVNYEYDALKRLASVTQHHGASDLVTAFGYDENGNRRLIRDAKGQETNVTFDSLDRARTIQFAGSAATGSLQQQYDYDPEGNVTAVSETAVVGGSTFARGYARTYDARDRLKTATDPHRRTVSFDYDAANNITAVTDASNKQTSYQYDSLNRLSQANLSGGRTARYNWRPDGTLEKVSYGAGMERNYAYDDADRLTSVTNTLGSQQSEEFDYGYDANSNRTSETKKFGGQTFRTVNYGYDELDRLTSVQAAGSPSSGITTQSGLSAAYFDNEDFTDLKLTRVDATVDFSWPGTTSPDASVDGETFSARWTGQVSPLYTEEYTFYTQTDEGVRLWVNGQLLIDQWDAHSSTEHSGRITLEAGRKYDIKMEFYDHTGDAEARLSWSSQSQAKELIPANRLNTPPTATGGAQNSTLAYTYDAVGNRLTETGTGLQGAQVNHGYTYDHLNRLTSASGYTGGDISYGYDNNGNLLSTTQNGQSLARFEYDARDQLRRVEGGAQQEVARYDYDFMRRRIGKAVGGAPEVQYTYAGAQMLGEYEAGGGLVNSYEYGTDLVRSDLRGEGQRWNFADGLGSTTALSGETGGAASVAARYEYDAWGGVVAGGGSANPFGYTGQRLDSETGLMPLGNGERYYAPELGRFLQQDSWSGVLTQAQTLNRYAYGMNNPNSYTDPTGMDPLLAVNKKTHRIELIENLTDGYEPLQINKVYKVPDDSGRPFVRGDRYRAVSRNTLQLVRGARRQHQLRRGDQVEYFFDQNGQTQGRVVRNQGEEADEVVTVNVTAYPQTKTTATAQAGVIGQGRRSASGRQTPLQPSRGGSSASQPGSQPGSRSGSQTGRPGGQGSDDEDVSGYFWGAFKVNLLVGILLGGLITIVAMAALMTLPLWVGIGFIGTMVVLSALTIYYQIKAITSGGMTRREKAEAWGGLTGGGIGGTLGGMGAGAGFGAGAGGGGMLRVTPEMTESIAVPPGTGAPTSSAPAVIESAGADIVGADAIVARAQKGSAINTSIRASVGEAEGYKGALLRGEIGLQRPGRVNEGGVDFITARLDPQTGQVEVIVTDVKTSTVGQFPTPKTTMPATWMTEVQEAVAPGRLNLNNPALEGQIRSAVSSGRVRLRQLNADYSPSPQGQGTIRGW